ncbi:MAG: Glu-tRNA(Gln) amidotransferase subunit GatE [Candidatus ainarchaeum sp.]|nr:Glu-tRNA(Gln) amidotransferase subunit GatE [Candidatus ainarchaeum sp.]
MTTIDYAKIGLKAGLEVHQQLNTKKLFIRTPSKLDETTNFQINRKLRPTASELGEYDLTALDAHKRNETFIYQGNTNNISLIEIDEEPPQPINKKALKAVIEIALLCESKIVSEGTIMRKTVIDGSNTSAFQRTMLLSIGGKLEINTNNTKKIIGIETIAIEEDACRPIKKEENNIYYNLDRLGFPLIELATAPDIRTPQEAQDTAKKIGEIFRLTGKTKRGKGTIRQDVNVSIAKGDRCEIKGCQELEQIKIIVEKEVERQLDLIELKNELNNKIKNTKEIFNKITDISKIFENSECKFAKNKKIFAIKLNKMNSLLGKKIGSKRFGSELSAYAKSTGVTGIIHKDELPNYGISEKEKQEIEKTLGCEEEDNFIFIIADEEKSKKAFQTIQDRILIAFEKIPKETRGAEEDGSSTYQRPISSAARMYPETDLPKEFFNSKVIESIRENLPKSVEEREKLYEELGLSKNHIDEMKLNNKARFFEELIKKGTNPITTATTLLQTLTELKRNNIQIEKITKQQIEEILLLEKKEKISKNRIKDYLIQITKGKTIKEINENQESLINEEEIQKIIIKIIKNNETLIKDKKMNAIGPLMGDLMKEENLKKIDGRILSEILKKEILKFLN